MSRKREWGRRSSDNQAYPKGRPDKGSLPRGLRPVVRRETHATCPNGHRFPISDIAWGIGDDRLMGRCPVCGVDLPQRAAVRKPRKLEGDVRPRVFYRGTVPESRKQIRTGDDYWDNRLFVSSSRELALSYGPNIERILPTEDARILYEGTGEFTRVAGNYNPRKENYLSYLSGALKSAEGLGYDAVHFERQGDVGTAIINPEKFIREG